MTEASTPVHTGAPGEAVSIRPGPQDTYRRPSLAHLWRMVPGGAWLALWLLITLRAGLELIALLSLNLQPITAVGGDWLNLLIRGNRPWSDLLSVWQRWDALWFQQIAEHGYHAGDGSTAFQPLYPLLSRLVSLLFLGHIVIAELTVSSAAFAVSMWLLYRLARLDTGPIAARLAVLLTAFFPVGFLLLAPYTESLYLALTLAAFWFARQGKPWAAGLAGLGAGLTRTVGIFLILPLAYEYLRQRTERGTPSATRTQSGGSLVVILKRVRLLGTHRGRPWMGRHKALPLLAALLPVAGMIGFVLYQRVIVGETQSIFQIQAHWGSHVAALWEVLPASWSHIVSAGDPVELLNLACLLLFGALGLALLGRLPLSYALYALPYLALFFSHESFFSPLMSVSRFMLVLFPCFILLGTWLARRPELAAGFLVVSAMLQVVLFQYFVHFGFVA